jgi:prepilin-type N-terminal cleavage/methylation domain-containing protein
MERLDSKGFTLIEVIVAMSVFIIVLMITGSAFKTILGQSTKTFRSEESNIEGMVGLEMLRHDLQQAGIGLFSGPSPLNYDEAVSTPAATYNDSPNHVPRPIICGDNLQGASVSDMGGSSNVLDGTDYLVVKATTVGRSKASQRWSYIVRNGNAIGPKDWPSTAENFLPSDYFVLLQKKFSTSVPIESDLQINTADNALWFKRNSPAFDAYTSQSNAIFNAYGIDDNNFRFPFNRADYFVAQTANMPSVCAPKTGVLYKATINQSDGKYYKIPILDCVADMQVALGWDTDLKGSISAWSNADGTRANPGDPNVIQPALGQGGNDNNVPTQVDIRNSLKVIKVYILAQNGRKDPSYTSPSTFNLWDDDGGPVSSILGKTYTLDPSMLNYRWKVYRIVVRPKNLLSNQ